MALPRCPTSARSPRRFPARRPATTRWPNSSAASVRACCRHCRKASRRAAGSISAAAPVISAGPGTTLRCGRGPGRGYRRRHAAACPRARQRQPFHRRRRREATVARRQLRPAVLQPGHPVVRRPPGGAGRGAADLAAGRRAGVQQPVRRYPGRVARQLAGGGRLRPRQSLPRLRRLPATRGRQRPAAADPAPRGPAPAFPRPAQPDPRTQGAGRAQPQPRAARRPDRAPAHPRAGRRLRAFPPARGLPATYRVVFGVLRKDS